MKRRRDRLHDRVVVGLGRDAGSHRPGLLQCAIFFAVGVYGGFIQAGVGIFLLAGLVLGAGYDLVRANAVKVLIVLCYSPIVLIVFLKADQIYWIAGLVLAVGNMAGAWIGTRVAAKPGAVVFVRYLLIAVVILSAIAMPTDVFFPGWKQGDFTFHALGQ